jgi:hypothetical protein
MAESLRSSACAVAGYQSNGCGRFGSGLANNWWNCVPVPIVWVTQGSKQRVNGDLGTHRARRDLLDARQIAAQARARLQDLPVALDGAHARAAARAETVWDCS